MEPIAAYHLLGVRVNAFTVDTFYATIRHSIEQDTRCIIGNHNLHSIYLYHHDDLMRRFYDEQVHYVFIDGMPLIAWGKLLGYPLVRAHRFTSVDWLPPLMQLAARHGWRVYYLGGKPGVAKRGAAILQARFAGLHFQTAHGYFDPDDAAANARILDTIHASRPHLLMVGMGMPRQEHWLYTHLHRLRVPCMLPVGGALDYVAGEIPTPPRRLSQLGLEWLVRLLAEPRRLGPRYLLEPWFLIPHMLRDLRQRGASGSRGA